MNPHVVRRFFPVSSHTQLEQAHPGATAMFYVNTLLRRGQNQTHPISCPAAASELCPRYGPMLAQGGRTLKRNRQSRSRPAC